MRNLSYLAIPLSLILVACGSDEPTSDAKDSAALDRTVTESVATEETATNEPADKAVLDQPVDSMPDQTSEVDEMAAKIEAGEKAFKVCKTCHTVNEGERHLQGPNLYGIVGAGIASIADFKYSSALESIDGVWSEENLDAYISNPKAFAPGTRMVLAERRAERRANIIAYLKSISE